VCSTVTGGTLISLIPLLHPGASPGSSSLLFSSLCRQLTTVPAKDETRAERTPRHPCIVSRITSRDCTNIKSAMRTLIAGFIGSGSASGDNEYYDDEEEGGMVRF
jgi:hypothetical protein